MIARWSLWFSDKLNQHSFTALGKAVVANKAVINAGLYGTFISQYRYDCGAGIQKTANKITKILKQCCQRKCLEEQDW